MGYSIYRVMVHFVPELAVGHVGHVGHVVVIAFSVVAGEVLQV